jgi:cytochrome c6
LFLDFCLEVGRRGCNGDSLHPLWLSNLLASHVA